MKKETVLSVHVKIDKNFEVKSEAGSANMILFHGTAESDYFKGVILPGGVDTQSQWFVNEGNIQTPAQDGEWRLSARYMLEGTDMEGQPCRIFIENNGSFENGEIVTRPRILTDSKALAWMEQAELVGGIVGEEDGICIEIMRKL